MAHAQYIPFRLWLDMSNCKPYCALCHGHTEHANSIAYVHHGFYGILSVDLSVSFAVLILFYEHLLLHCISSLNFLILLCDIVLLAQTSFSSKRLFISPESTPF